MKSSKYKGVHFHEKINKWEARLTLPKDHPLRGKGMGLYETEADANTARLNTIKIIAWAR